MSTPLNYAGSKYLQRNGTSKRAHRTSISIEGVECQVEYEVHGDFLPATEIDDYCAPTCRVLLVEVNGADVTRWFDADDLSDLEQRIEGEWK